jgi:methylenetetrahydrofolate dehydrogenase (NADP+)/methenyltetrahydrofolate cyclohydrolase
MSAKIIDGRAHADRLANVVAGHVQEFNSKFGFIPGLAVVLVGDNPASEVYVRSKETKTRKAGMHSFVHRLPASTSEETLIRLVQELNADDAVDGILIQLPLPKHIDSVRILTAVAPDKDVDGFHVVNVGRLATGQSCLTPCTPYGCMMLLREEHPTLDGLEAVIVGRSNIVGKPMAQLLLNANCTVTIAHSRTLDLANVCRRADILVAAVGIPQFIQGDWIKPGATVIDVGINRVIADEQGQRSIKIVGDVDYAAAKARAGAITPVPGGVGPMTIATLMANTLVASASRRNLPVPSFSEN